MWERHGWVWDLELEVMVVKLEGLDVRKEDVDADGGTDGCNSMGAGVDVRGYVFAARLIKANIEAAQGEQEIDGMEGKRHNSHI